MPNEVLVLLKLDDIQLTQKKKLLGQKFSNLKINYEYSAKALHSRDDLDNFTIIIDFDASNPEHFRLISHLKNQELTSESFQLFNDIFSSLGQELAISKEFKEKIDKFVEKLMPIRESIPNKFLNPPNIHFLDARLFFSHYEEDALYFYSTEKISANSIDLQLKVEINTDLTEVQCEGQIDEENPSDQDSYKKYFYKLSLNQPSLLKLSSFFKAMKDLEDISSQWGVGFDE